MSGQKGLERQVDKTGTDMDHGRSINLRERRAPRYDISTLLLTGDIGGAGSAMLAEIRVTAKVVEPMFDVATIGGGGDPG